jgi:hypothetical protein
VPLSTGSLRGAFRHPRSLKRRRGRTPGQPSAAALHAGLLRRAPRRGRRSRSPAPPARFDFLDRSQCARPYSNTTVCHTVLLETAVEREYIRVAIRRVAKQNQPKPNITPCTFHS